MNNWIKFIRVLSLILAATVVSFSAFAWADTTIEGQKISRPDSHELVVTYHKIATRIGYEILNSGGNAFDAFVAATCAQYVLSPGVTSPAGPLGVLIYDAKTKQCHYLDADMNEVLDPNGKWNPYDSKGGSSFLAPGAILGLEEISKRYGRLPFKKVLEPAINLARNGFPIDLEYEWLVSTNKEILQRSEYGKRTYFSNEIGPLWGDVIRLPEMGDFLSRLSEEGSPYFYRGEWAEKCVQTVQGLGAKLSLGDLSSYRTKWLEPRKISYRGYDLYSTAGRVFGGLITLETLKVLEKADPKVFEKHYSQSADGLELMVRAFQASNSEITSEIYNGGFKKMDDPQFISSVLGKDNVDKLWKGVNQNGHFSFGKDNGTHSFHIVVIDKEGNVVSGTNTSESSPWGEGIFVNGVLLNAGGKLSYFITKPGERILSPLSMQIGIKEGKVRFALGSFSTSLLQASFQFISNLVDYHFSAQDAVSMPRFGGEGRLDKRVNQEIVEALSKRGITFTQDGDGDYVETGLGSVAVVRDDGTLEGAVAPLSGMADQAEVDYRKTEPGAAIPAIRSYLKIDKSAQGKTWGDKANGGKIIAKIKQRAIEFQIETGTGWGCMASYPCNIEPFVAPGMVNLRGYHFFQFKAFAPKKLFFRNFLIEPGAGPPPQDTNKGVNGADGEIYIFPSFQGTGKWETYRLDISKLGLCGGWGNQQGNKILDLQALSKVVFHFMGNQGKGNVQIKDIKFLVK